MKRGFTLIELLVVIAVIAILAMMGVANFGEAQVRAKVSRARADLRVIGAALEAYRTDHNDYPRSSYEYEGAVKWEGYPALTTPVAYISSIPIDPFSPSGTWRAGGNPPLYFTGNPQGRADEPQHYWLLLSVGPDLRPNLRDESDERAGRSGVAQPADDGYLPAFDAIGTIYDPSNGTLSLGDVILSNAPGLRSR